MTMPESRAREIQIPRRDRSEIPTVPGWYLVHDAARGEPLLLRWSRWSKRWEYPHSIATVPVAGWLGPIRGVPDDLAGAE